MNLIEQIETGAYRTTNWFDSLAGQNPIRKLSKISTKRDFSEEESQVINSFIGASSSGKILAQSTYENNDILEWKNPVDGATDLEYTKLECVITEQEYGFYLALGVYVQNKRFPIVSITGDNIFANYFYVSLLNSAGASITTIERKFPIEINPVLPANAQRHIPIHYRVEDPTLNVADVDAVRFSLWEYIGLATY